MTKTILGSATAAPTLLLLTALATAPAPAGAQEPAPRAETLTECRCVDAQGNEVESCTCLRTPDAQGLMARFFGPRERPRVGITLNPEQPAEDDAVGARIQDLLDDGPADGAGLREGDVVVSFHGHDLQRSLGAEREEDFDLDASLPVQRLLALARELEPGEEVRVEYLRDGERRSTTLVARDLEMWGARAWSLPEIREFGRVFEGRGPDGGVYRFRGPEGGELRPRGPEARRFDVRVPDGGAFRLRGDGDGTFVIGEGRFDACPPQGEGEGEARVWVFGDACPGGLRLVGLNPALGEYFGTEDGVLVADVHPESALGLEPGDVIRRIGSREVDSPERVRAILRSYEPDEPVTLHIVRDGRAMDVQGRLAP